MKLDYEKTLERANRFYKESDSYGAKNGIRSNQVKSILQALVEEINEQGVKEYDNWNPVEAIV